MGEIGELVGKAGLRRTVRVVLPGMNRQNGEWSRHEVAVSRGDLHFRSVGAGPLIIALHGIQGTSEVWRDVGRLLCDQYTFVAPDMRGREPSLVPEEPDEYALHCFSADLEALIAEIGRPVVLVGWSMGVLVLFEYLRRGGRGPDQLVLTGGTAHPGAAKWFEGDTLEGVAREAGSRATRLGLGRAATPNAVAASWFHAKSSDYRDLLDSINVPTLVLHGAEDGECPRDQAELMAARLPCSELEVWPWAGHNLMAHDSGRFAASVRGFLDSANSR
jgi:pimeloyl-ACP methyl ester carboxylesterase